MLSYADVWGYNKSRLRGTWLVGKGLEVRPYFLFKEYYERDSDSN
jgi:hypothetical protein